MDFLILLGSYAGFFLLVRRMNGWPAPDDGALSRPHPLGAISGSPHTWPLVSIIVPARNEAPVIGGLLESLGRLTYPNKEIIVVDDQSSDGTGEVAHRFGARVVRGLERPAGWRGKQWACHQGAADARGKWLLFTDADTVHDIDSLEKALGFARDGDLEMLTCLPYHRCRDLWETLLGPFQFMLLTSTVPFGRPRPGKVYAIGQYLMFRRDFYERLGGHGSVRDEMVEDLPMANLCLQMGGRYGVYTESRLFSVRMYDRLGDFIAGWRRNFRAGMTGSSKSAVFEMFLLMAAFSGGGHLFESWLWTLPALGSVSFLWFRQKHLGEFSWLGPLLFPFSLGLFCYISALAAYDQLTGKALVWKGRAYQ